MGITFTPGSTTADGTEQTLYDITADNHFATFIFTNNMASGDTLEVRIYTYDEQGTTMSNMGLPNRGCLLPRRRLNRRNAQYSYPVLYSASRG